MNPKGNEPLREMLAAEYALGTLRGGARRRFERWMRDDPDLAALSQAWSQRLTPLCDAVAQRNPPARVWRAIEARLPGHPTVGGATGAAGWWDRLALWRGVAAAFAVIAVVAIALAVRPPPSRETQFVQVETLPGAVATVTDPKSGALVAVVLASHAGDELIVKVAPGVRVGPGQALQLWTAPKQGERMVSMGMLPTVAAGEPVRLTSVDQAKVADAKAFGLSLEPVGGSPQPTQVLGIGALVRLSG
jgi:anti-sigma-K factor RskA